MVELVAIIKLFSEAHTLLFVCEPNSRRARAQATSVTSTWANPLFRTAPSGSTLLPPAATITTLRISFISEMGRQTIRSEKGVDTGLPHCHHHTKRNRLP